MTTIATTSAIDIQAAAQRLRGITLRTPLQYSPHLSNRYGARVFLKREDLQLGGSYKIRGAYNLMASLGDAERARGVVTASTGNHARAVAEAAQRLGLNATIFVPEGTSDMLQAGIRRAGGLTTTVRPAGPDLQTALAAAERWANQASATLVHPYADDRIVAGQASLAVEILEQLAEHQLMPQMVLAPLGGGGLVSGVGAYLQTSAPQTELVAVRPDQPVGLLAALNAGGRNPLADQVGARELAVAEPVVRAALEQLAEFDGIAASAAGALATAGLTGLGPRLTGLTVVAIVSGGATPTPAAGSR